MKTLTIRDFRTRPRQVREGLEQAGEAILTVSGRPVALLVPVTSGTLDATLESLRRARAQQALRELRHAAKAGGATRLDMAAVDALIARTRAERRKRAIS